LLVPEGLFRKAAIDKVSSPEQLDLLMRITSPVGWLALLTIGVMVAAVGGWAVVGSIADLVDGAGTLFRGERLYEVKASMSGTIVALNARPGAVVTAGQTIASLKRQRAETEQRDADAVTIQKNLAMAARKREELATLQRQRSLQAELVAQGYKAPKDLLGIDREINAVRGDLDGLEAEVKQLRAQAQATTEVKTTESGRIVEVLKSAGDKVREDEPLITIEPQGRQAEGQPCGGNVHAIVYIGASSAGRIKPGQLARVSPSDVKREEYGFIIGKVEWVAAHPASTTDMTEKLKNDQLVRQFMAGGPVFEARVCLEANPGNTVNPFKWSSSQGPPKGTEAGTTCFVSVVVDERKPYTYVIPAARRAAGL
jgi:HlyD family secretion protein